MWLHVPICTYKVKSAGKCEVAWVKKWVGYVSDRSCQCVCYKHFLPLLPLAIIHIHVHVLIAIPIAVSSNGGGGGTHPKSPASPPNAKSQLLWVTLIQNKFFIKQFKLAASPPKNFSACSFPPTKINDKTLTTTIGLCRPTQKIYLYYYSIRPASCACLLSIINKLFYTQV